MADNSIERYREMLKKVQADQQAQQDLTDLGLPEVSENPVLDMIDQGIAEEKEAAKMAQLRKLQVKNDEDELADTNLDADQKADIEATIRNSRESLTGLPSKENLEKRAELLEAGTPGTNVFEGASEKPELPPVAAPDPDFGQSRTEILNRYREAVKPSPDVQPVSPLEQAKSERARQEALADISEGISRFSAAYGGGGVYDIKPDISGAERMRKAAQRGVTEAEKEAKRLAVEKKAEADSSRQARIDKLNSTLKMAQIAKMKKEGISNAALDDPNSPESRKLQDMEMAAHRTQGLPYNEEDMRKMSANYLTGKAYVAGKRKIANQTTLNREKRLVDKFGFQKNEKFDGDARNALKDMRQTEQWKAAEKTLTTIPEIEMLLDDAYEKGGQSLAMLGPRIAKGIAGEVGVLTEQDVTRYVQNPQIAQGVNDDLKRISQGKITQTSYDNIKRLMKISRQVAQEKLDKAIDREATLFARREKIPYEDARMYIDNNYTKTINKPTKAEKEQAREVRRKTKDGRIAIFDADTKKFLRYE